MKCKNYYCSCIRAIKHTKGISLLLMRLVLAYGFYGTATMKWSNIEGVADMFASIGIPMSHFNAYLVASIEALGVILLVLGLWTRFITVPLMIIMIVAITTVHWANGFHAGNNGFEIPLYYLLMLFALFAHGSGKIGIDHLIKRKCCGRCECGCSGEDTKYEQPKAI